MSSETIIRARYLAAETALVELKQAANDAARVNAFALDGCRDMLSEIEKVCREAEVATFPQGTSAIDMVRRLAQALAEERLAHAASTKRLVRFLRAAQGEVLQQDQTTSTAEPESGPPAAGGR